jgi:hypothetical protein
MIFAGEKSKDPYCRGSQRGTAPLGDALNQLLGGKKKP